MRDTTHVNPESVLREKALFLQALDIEPGARRDQYLDEACGDDARLRSRVQRLLNINANPEGPLDPAHYDSLLDELDRLVNELFDEGRFLSELGESIQTLGDDYELIEELGRGSAGVVYRARQISLNREVAVKVIHGSALASESERERFRVEVEAAAGLHHPNIVPVYEIGRDGNLDYFSMPLMSGGTLTDLIESGSMSLRDGVGLLAKICRTAHAAHRGGVIHRDLKPDNILLDTQGEPHISDFGLAYRLEQHRTLTIPGGIMGTPAYMAPEQADPHVGPVTTATDVYSLGVILYRVLTGQPPFHHESLFKVLEMVKTTPPRSPRAHDSSIDRDLETIVLKCLEKRPASRYDSALDLAEDLEAWLEHRPISVRPTSSLMRVWKWARRRPTHAMLAVISILFVLTLGVVGPVVAFQQTRLRHDAELARAAAEQQRLVADQQRQAADRVAAENRALAYSYSTRLAAAVANTDRASLAAHGVLRALAPSPGETDARGWEWYYLFAEVYLEPRVLEGDGQPVESVSFSPSGELVAVCERGGDGTVLRDGLHMALIRKLVDPGANHVSHLWRPDENQLVTLSDRGTINVWDTRSGRSLAQLTTAPQILSLGGWQSDHELIGLTEDSQIKSWDLSDLSAISESLLTTSSVAGLREVKISPDGRYLAGLAEGSKVYLWSITALDQPAIELDGHEVQTTGLAWHRDSRWLASTAGDEMRVWEVPGGARLFRVSKTLERLTALAWDPNGLQVMFGGENGFIWLTDMVTGGLRRVEDYEPTVTSLDWCAATHSFIVALGTGTVELRRFGLPSHHRRLTTKQAGWSSIRWSADGSAVGVVEPHREPEFFDVFSGKSRPLPSEFAPPPRMPNGWSPTESSPTAVTHAWHPGTNRIATGNADGSVSVWDAEHNERLAHFATPSRTAPQLAWHPDGTRIASAGNDRAVHLWDWDLGESLLSLEHTASMLTDLRWSPEGTRLAASTRDRTLFVWDATAGYLMNGNQSAVPASP